MTHSNTTPAIDPGTQSREQRFWLLDNGFQLVQDTMGITWLYTFRAGPVLPATNIRRAGRAQFCVGVFDGSWAVYQCGPTQTTTISTGESFREVLGQALRLMAGAL